MEKTIFKMIMFFIFVLCVYLVGERQYKDWLFACAQYEYHLSNVPPINSAMVHLFDTVVWSALLWAIRHCIIKAAYGEKSKK